jgi:Family of unknown function (DUF6494)
MQQLISIEISAPLRRHLFIVENPVAVIMGSGPSMSCEWLAERERNWRPMVPMSDIGYPARPSSPRTHFGRIAMDEDRFNVALRKFLKVVGITSQREIERVVREDKVEGTELKLRMTLTAENAPLNHIVEETVDLR